jgi:hypothetical protein
MASGTQALIAVDAQGLLCTSSAAMAGCRFGQLQRARVQARSGPGPVQPELGRSSESSGRGRLDSWSGPGRVGPAGHGTGRARPRPGVRLQAKGGGCGAFPPRGGRAQPALFPPLGVAALLCVSVVLSAARIRLRRLGLASTPSRCTFVEARPLMTHRGSRHAGLRPS